ncbi:hypothetical protein C7M84_018245 [Penaeus vannamei]|uniref:Uncharacterized protein n=1 Tax=Penaeus vannamei TaxID=6689 RepID=A0A3R7MK54_PENVA|nr:hypothetical protein C7M84_018245 [Penaeus vannamei]
MFLSPTFPFPLFIFSLCFSHFHSVIFIRLSLLFLALPYSPFLFLPPSHFLSPSVTVPFFLSCSFPLTPLHLFSCSSIIPLSLSFSQHSLCLPLPPHHFLSCSFLLTPSHLSHSLCLFSCSSIIPLSLSFSHHSLCLSLPPHQFFVLFPTTPSISLTPSLFLLFQNPTFPFSFPPFSVSLCLRINFFVLLPSHALPSLSLPLFSCSSIIPLSLSLSHHSLSLSASASIFLCSFPLTPFHLFYSLFSCSIIPLSLFSHHSVSLSASASIFFCAPSLSRPSISLTPRQAVLSSQARDKENELLSSEAVKHEAFLLGVVRPSSAAPKLLPDQFPFLTAVTIPLSRSLLFLPSTNFLVSPPLLCLFSGSSPSPQLHLSFNLGICLFGSSLSQYFRIRSFLLSSGTFGKEYPLVISLILLPGNLRGKDLNLLSFTVFHSILFPFFIVSLSLLRFPCSPISYPSPFLPPPSPVSFLSSPLPLRFVSPSFFLFFSSPFSFSSSFLPPSPHLTPHSRQIRFFFFPPDY